MSKPASSAALPVAYLLLRTHVVVNWLGGVGEGTLMREDLEATV